MVKGPDHDEWKWLLCNNRQLHDQQQLMLCQTIANNCLQELRNLVHRARHLCEIPQTCKCVYTIDPMSNVYANINKVSFSSNNYEINLSTLSAVNYPT